MTAPDGRRLRRRGMALSDHHRWRRDFDLVRGLGTTLRRYGVPRHPMHTGPVR